MPFLVTVFAMILGHVGGQVPFIRIHFAAPRHMRAVLATIFMAIGLLTACGRFPTNNVSTQSQAPSHQAEFVVAYADYRNLLEALDAVAAPFHLQRFGAEPGLDELRGRAVLFINYRTDIKETRIALSVTDITAPEKVRLWVFGDYFGDAEDRMKFITEVATIVHHYGGELLPYHSKPRTIPLSSP